MSNREIVSTIKAAKLLGVSQQSVRKWCQSGKIKAKSTPGGFYKIEISELERFKKEFNMPELSNERYALIVEENKDRIKFFGDLLEMLDFKVVTASQILDIGLSIGKIAPELIVLGIEEGRDYLISSFSRNKMTGNIPILVISEKDEKDEVITAPLNLKVEVLFLSEPFDIQGFKSKVTALLEE